MTLRWQNSRLRSHATIDGVWVGCADRWRDGWRVYLERNCRGWTSATAYRRRCDAKSALEVLATGGAMRTPGARRPPRWVRGLG